MRFWALLVAVFFVGSSVAVADQFHYNNVLVGDRASGMGGAFCAVADDASGVVYNPAGLAFALSNDISGSANAFYQKKVTYKNAAFEKDFVEESQGTTSPFVGALGKLDHLMPGLVFAFGIFAPDTELKDQNDLLYSKDGSQRLHRTANLRAGTTKIGLAVAKRLGSGFGIGLGLTYIMIDELAQVYQDFTLAFNGVKVDSSNNQVTDSNGDPVAATYYRYLTKNVRERLEAQAVEAGLGMQFALKKVSFGLHVKVPFIVYERYRTDSEQTIHYTDSEGKGVVDITNAGITTSDAGRSVVEKAKVKKPLKMLPTEVRFGTAYFASATLLTTADVIYYTETKGDLSSYERDAVLNYALGAEYYMTSSYPIRLGLFTNNDARPKPSSSKTDQRDSIDYMGGSLFLAMVQPNSQISVGVIYQNGTGKSQKVAGSTVVQNVSASSTTLGFSVSHNF